MSKALRLAAIAATSFMLTSPSQAEGEGKALYAPCKACHLATGKGVPGAFPPLKEQITAFAATPDGRTYLALILKRGGIGRIKVEGKTYVGAMPAQSRLSADQIAILLNYVVTDIAGGEGVEAFTAEEVTGAINAHPKARGKDVIGMRPDPAAAAAKKTAAPGPEKAAPAQMKEAKAPEEAPMTSDDKRWEAHLKERATKS
ncbi:MAG: cytochrome c [Pseudomonadota bacterium]